MLLALFAGVFAYGANPPGDDDDHKPDSGESSGNSSSSTNGNPDDEGGEGKKKCPPYDNEDSNDEEGGGDGSGNGSINFKVSFGTVPFERAVPMGKIGMTKTVPSPTMFTPQAMMYRSKVAVQVADLVSTSGGLRLGTVGPDGKPVEYLVPTGASRGAPVGRKVARPERIELLDANGAPLAPDGGPAAFVVIRRPAGDRIVVNMTTKKVERIVSKAGHVISLPSVPEELALKVERVDGVMRQIKSAQGLADFVQISPMAYEIRHYAPSQVGAYNATTKTYALSGTPYRVIRKENPTGDPARLDQVKITDTWGTRTTTDNFTYDEDLKEWLLTKGDGTTLQRKESKMRIPGPASNERTYVRTLRNEHDQVISTTREVWRDFPWREQKVSETIEPDTLNLTTSYTYHTDSTQPGYTKLRSKQYPDGFWELFGYDVQNRVVQKTTPWKDTTLANASSGPRVIVTRSYASLDSGDAVENDDHRARTITESVVTSSGGSPVVVKKTFYVYRNVNGVYTEIEERAATASAAYGATGNLRSTKVYHTSTPGSSGYDEVASGKIHYHDREDGTRVTYTYSRNRSDLERYMTITEVTGTPTNPAGIDGLSTKEEKVHNVRGKLVEQKSYIRQSGGWHLVSTVTQTWNEQDQLLARYKDGRQIYAAVYDGKLLTSKTDENGVTTTYTYDSLDRIETETKTGVSASGSYAAQAPIVTTYLRELGGLDCGCDGELLTVTSSGGLSLANQVKKDAAGRVIYRKDEAGLETTYVHTLGGRQSTRTNPDGGTVVELKFADRRVASITGTGVIAEYRDYGVNSDGTTWEKTSLVSATGERWVKVTHNHLGQEIKEEEPAYDGGVLTTSYTYNGKGQLVRTRQRHVQGTTETTLLADKLNEYDWLGNVTRSGLDVNGNGTLDLASADRVIDTVTSFAQHEFAWWLVAQAKAYPTLNSASSVQVTETRQRLSGYSATLADEWVSVDRDGNVSRQLLEIDFANRLRTLTNRYPDTSEDVVRVVRNGLLVAENAKGVAAMWVYGHDALGRQTSSRDPRHAQSSLRSYDATTGQLTAEADAAGNVTSYDYYPNGVAGAGQVKLVTDAAGKTRRSAYDLLGRIAQQWGSAEYPQSYTYTAHGELHTLRTWRDAGSANLNGATWPSLTGGDVTTWTYQAATGLLTRKQYADGQGTDYTYDKLNRVATRTWARSVSGARVSTVYGYAANTGELTTVDYSDTTPDVSVTYDRFGRRATTTDGTGTRTFVYSTTTLRLEQEQLPAFFGDRVLRRDYQGNATGEVPGRVGGFRLGTASVPAADQEVVYGFDALGRLNRVTSGAGTFAYDYASNSNLLEKLTSPVHTATRSYETNRDVIDILENKVGGTTVSKFDYTVNAIGQRIARAQTGTAFSSASTDVFGYNDRGEVTSATNATLPARNQSFAYDPIGNRLSFTTTGGTTSYTSNSLNQYGVISGFASSPAYDLDGNQTATGLGQAYAWDAENRLVSVEPVVPVNGDKKVVNAYDGQSRRVRRQVFTMTGGSWSLTSDEKYVYEGWNVIAVLDATSSSLPVLRHYTWGLDLVASLEEAGGVGGLLALQEGSATYHYTYDDNGNVSELLNTSGAIVAHYEYTPFGETFVASGAYAAINEYRFSTKPIDEVAGLYYYNYRFYNPIAGKWCNRDLIEEEGGINLYGFVLNDPIGLVDPFGLEFLERAIGVLPGWAQRGLANMPEPPKGLVNAAAGFGDNLSMGLTEKIREGLGSNDQVDKCSDAYKGGDTAGEYFDRLNPKGWAKGAAKSLGAKAAAKSASKKAAHGNKLDDRPATLYEKYDKNGNFQKHGITKHEDPSKRYTKKEIDGGEVRPVDRGPRREMAQKERERVETNPGPQNREPWAGSRQQ